MTECMMWGWNSPVYTFFWPVPRIEENSSCYCHVFKCYTAVCKGKGHSMVLIHGTCQTPEPLTLDPHVTALLFPSHVFCSVFIGMRTGCLNHKSPAIWLVTCSSWAPLYGWSQVSSELCYMVVTDIGLAELSLLWEHLVREWINGQGIGY